MGKEKCWRCHKTKNDVELRSTDDRLCQSCFDKNESALKRGVVNISPINQGKSPGSLAAGTVGSKGNITHSSRKTDNTVSCVACCEGGAACWLVCDVCTEHFHPGCVKLTDNVANKLQTLIAAVGWVCPGCRSELLLLRSNKSTILEMVATVKDELQQLRTDFETYRVAHPDPATSLVSPSSDSQQPLRPTTAATIENSLMPTKRVLAAVHKEFSDKERRKSNIVVTGMSEVDGIDDDIDTFSRLCETCLPIKPAVIRERCRRLGRKTDGKIRPLLISLSSESSAAELLQCAPLLRQTPDAEGIYINADLTPAEALAAFQARERRRARRSAETESTPTSRSVTNSASSTVVLQACSSVPPGETVPCT